jgi:formamidopyrimidine-DNA glycosylase
MPELPEVQTIVNDLQPLLVDKFIIQLKIIDNKLKELAESANQSLIVKQQITALFRRAKNIVIQLANNYYLVIHLKMSGQLIWLSQQDGLAGKNLIDQTKPLWPAKSTRLILKLSDGSQLFFNDTRKFGWLKLMNYEQWTDYQQSLGIEPLEQTFSPALLQSIFLKHPHSKIKPLLLDQHQLAGLGNIYVDESLFAAKIRPTRLAGNIKPIEIKKLQQAIINILIRAVAGRGTSFSDYRDGQGRRGNFQTQLQVYGRSGQACFCCGQSITKTKLAGRGTHFCSQCQK